MKIRTTLHKLAAYSLVGMLLVLTPSIAGAQEPAPQPQPDPKAPFSVVGDGAGQYVQAAAPSLLGAYDRAIAEIDAAPRDWSPKQVHDASFRRRLLELRLLMDLNSFAYDKQQMKMFREFVDTAYEGIGVYQDISDFEKELKITVDPAIVAARRAEMDQALWMMRSPNIRSQMRAFLAQPLWAIRPGTGPGLWDLTGTVASSAYDASGNAAHFQAGIVRWLQSTDLGAKDIFDPIQAFYFHEVRKQMRNVVLLSAMFPATREATRDVVTPLDDLVDDYGDVLEAYNSYRFARRYNLDTTDVEVELRREFDRAMMMKNAFVENHALDAMAVRLNGVRDGHRAFGLVPAAR